MLFVLIYSECKIAKNLLGPGPHWQGLTVPPDSPAAQRFFYSLRSLKIRQPQKNCWIRHCLGVILDVRLIFEVLGNDLYLKNNKKSIDFLRKVQNMLPQNALTTIYNSFLSSHLHYGDTIYG